MNVRKPVDYGAMYRELAAILAQNLPQMDENLRHRQDYQPASGERYGGHGRRVLAGEFP